MKTDVPLLVHSFYAGENSEARLFINIITYTLSCMYAKKSGFTIYLHADELGAKYLNHCPYDKIIVDLKKEDFPLSDILYAAPKLKVLEQYPLGTIHIDGDVFLKSPNLKNILNFSNYDVIVQSVETPPLYGWGWKEATEALSKCTYPKWANRKCQAMYNNGIVGFNNQELKDEWFKTYWNMYEQFKTKGMKFGVPDIIIEQQFLRDLCEYKKYKVKTLLSGEHPSKDANLIGYQHLIGHAKCAEYQRTLKKVYDLDPEMYFKLKNKFYKNIKFCWKYGTFK